jgi:hypothetical protein
MVDVAQLVRASDCDSEGRGFESRLSPKAFSWSGKAFFMPLHIRDFTGLPYNSSFFTG